MAKTLNNLDREAFEACTNNRERVLCILQTGEATKQDILDNVDITEKSLASVFVQLRLMGHYPIKGADGVFTIGTAEEYAASRPEPKEKKESTPKTPEQLVEAAQKRENRAAAIATSAAKKYEEDPCRKNELKKVIADAELELASILLGEAEENLASNTPVQGYTPTNADADSDYSDNDFDADGPNIL